MLDEKHCSTTGLTTQIASLTDLAGMKAAVVQKRAEAKGRSEKPFLGFLILARLIFGSVSRRYSVVV